MRFSSRRFLALIAIFLIHTTCYSSTLRTWSGGGDGIHWSSATNWNNGLPVDGDSVQFSGGALMTTCDVTTNIAEIIFTTSAKGSVVSGAVNIDASQATINIEDDGGCSISATITIKNALMIIKSGAAGITTTLDGVISGSQGLRVYGPGQVVFNQVSNNTYTGTTTVASNDANGSAGQLVLASTSAGSLVPSALLIGGTNTGQPANSARLTLQFRDCISDASAVNIAADGVLDLNGMTESVASLAGAGNVINDNANFAVGDASTTTFSGSLSGTGTFTKLGTGTVTLTGTPNVSGQLKITNGTLILNTTTTAPGFTGSIMVGDGVGATNSAVLRLTGNATLSSTSAVTVAADGQLDASNLNETVASLTVSGGSVLLGSGQLTNNGLLTMSGGTISSTTGTLNLGGDVTVSPAGVQQCMITSNVNLNSTTRNFTVNSGSVQPELTITGVIADGSVPASGIFKNGTGTLDIITTSNTFSGTTTIDKGVMRVKAGSVTALQGPIYRRQQSGYCQQRDFARSYIRQ